MSLSAQMNQHNPNKAVEPNEFRATGDFALCCDNQEKMWVFFPNYLQRLDHAILMDTFPELVGDIFCSGRGITSAWQIPKSRRGFGQWGWQRVLSHLPDSSQQGREQGLPTGFAGASGGES